MGIDVRTNREITHEHCYGDPCYTRLALAIIEDSITEWKQAEKFRKKNGYADLDYRSPGEVQLIKFFNSAWFELLLDCSAPSFTTDWIKNKLGVPNYGRVTS